VLSGELQILFCVGSESGSDPPFVAVAAIMVTIPQPKWFGLFNVKDTRFSPHTANINQYIETFASLS
jgi:hypothetical protein